MLPTLEPDGHAGQGSDRTRAAPSGPGRARGARHRELIRPGPKGAAQGMSPLGLSDKSRRGRGELSDRP